MHPLSDVARTTGWAVHAFPDLASTNDEAARRLEAGDARFVVVADRQSAGRGRGGNAFASPAGGLYASLGLSARSADLPAPLVLATAVALAEAIEAVAAVAIQVKWPNDVWIGGRKVGGILLETRAAARRDADDRIPVVVGLGVNLDRVPPDLPPEIAAATTALALHAKAPVDRAGLLAALLARVDVAVARLSTPAGRVEVERAYRARLVWLGQPVRYVLGDDVRRGVLLDVSLDRGLAIAPAADGRTGGGAGGGASGAPSWVSAAHVRALRADTP